MYNFATYIKVATQGFTTFHTVDNFFTACEKSRPFKLYKDQLDDKTVKKLDFLVKDRDKASLIRNYVMISNDKYLVKHNDERVLVDHMKSQLVYKENEKVDDQDNADFGAYLILRLDDEKDLYYSQWKSSIERDVEAEKMMAFNKT